MHEPYRQTSRQLSSVQVGNRAEQAAAEYLVRQGYEIVERNYRRPYCEIDIVARRHDVIHFVEVKYRSSQAQGGGLDYIGPQKLRHMGRAAAAWNAGRQWRGEYTLAAIEVGAGYEVQQFIPSIDI